MGIFSVVIPVYNAEETVGEALASVANQTMPELIREIIVIDDGSTDGSASCVRQFSDECDIPVRLISQENAGPSAARNTGLRAATGDYIAFLDADDIWVPDKLERQWEILQENPQIDLLAGGLSDGALRILLRSHSDLYHVSLRDYCWKSILYTSTVVIRRARIEEAGLFDEKMSYAEDMNYYQRFFRWGEVYYLPVKLADYGKSKAYYGQTGLSGQLRKMHRGRRHNFAILHHDRQISTAFYWLMLLFGEIKYMRRKILVQLQRKNVDAREAGRERE